MISLRWCLFPHRGAALQEQPPRGRQRATQTRPIVPNLIRKEK
nr:MAG TPA: hypothetical protein [Siphoviridae sp. ctX8T1]DAO64590.1 MAG TPA: hypothetical protein [Caudoviricetes sp.]